MPRPRRDPDVDPAPRRPGGPFGIRVNCIAPETILTERNDERIPPDTKVAMVAAHPIRRLGTPDDVAQAALYLASDAASWVTGLVLGVSGGAVMVGVARRGTAP